MKPSEIPAAARAMAYWSTSSCSKSSSACGDVNAATDAPETVRSGVNAMSVPVRESRSCIEITPIPSRIPKELHPKYDDRPTRRVGGRAHLTNMKHEKEPVTMEIQN